jgi:hypothetical protein
MLWNTTKAGTSLSNQIKIPTTNIGTYDCYIDWGDNNVDHITTWDDPKLTHTYEIPGEHEVRITGTFTGFRFNNGGDRLKLIDIRQWGLDFKLGNAGSYFKGCTYLVISATDMLNVVGMTNGASMFYNCYAFNSPLTWLDTSNFTDLNYMLLSCRLFNQPLNINTSKATTMYAMLEDCRVFNQPLSLDTGKVIFMTRMLNGCLLFDQDISAFDIKVLVDATDMLKNTAFSRANYDLLLAAWESQVEKLDVDFHAGNAQYSIGAPKDAREVLTDTSHWLITDGGLYEE